MHRSSLSHLFSVCTVLSLSACAVQTYVEPAAGPRAKVRFVTTSKDPTVLRSYTDLNCSGESEWMRLRDGTITNNTGKSLDIPLNVYSKNAAREVYVEANKPVTVLFDGGEEDNGVNKGYHSCGTLVSFSYGEGKSYEVKFTSGRTCSATVSEIQNNAGQWSRVPLAAFNERTNVTPGCLSRFKAMRW